MARATLPSSNEGHTKWLKSGDQAIPRSYRTVIAFFKGLA